MHIQLFIYKLSINSINMDNINIQQISSIPITITNIIKNIISSALSQ